MPAIPSLGKTWSNGEVLTHTDLNGNFATIRDNVNAYALFRDVASQTVSVAITFSVSQTFAAGIAVTGAITMATSTSQIVPGATSFSVRNTANSADNLLVSDAGAVTVRNGLTVTAGGATITAGGLTVTAGNVAITAGALTFGAATSQVVPGATSFAVRDTANAQNNLIVLDNGNTTVRGNLTVSGGTLTVGTLAGLTGAFQVNNLVGTTAGVVPTNTTDRFTTVANCAGAPTGAVADGMVILDSTNHRLYVRSGSTWRYTALT